MKKLNIQELESRIAPSMSLFSLLGSLFGTDGANEVWDIVDPDTGVADVPSGPVDVNGDGVADAVAPRGGSIDTNNIILSDALASRIMSVFGG